MLKAYSNNMLLGGEWLLGAEDGEESSGDGASSGGSMPSMSDIQSGLSKGLDLAKQGQAAIKSVTGGGTKAAGVKSSSTDPYWRCPGLKTPKAIAQCRYEVARALRLRKVATAKKPTSTYLVAGGILAVVGGAAWLVLR
jgi:hypothetical protein